MARHAISDQIPQGLRKAGIMTAATVYLILMTMNHGYSPIFQVSKMSSWDECFKSLDAAKIHVSPGDENEVSVAMFCTANLPEKH